MQGGILSKPSQQVMEFVQKVWQGFKLWDDLTSCLKLQLRLVDLKPDSQVVVNWLEWENDRDIGGANSTERAYFFED